VRDRLYVVDRHLAIGSGGCLLAVDSGGKVDLVASPAWDAVYGVAVRSNGHPIACDAGLAPGESSVWEIDPAITDPSSSATLLSGGAQYAQVQDVTRDAGGQVFLVDWGEYDVVNEIFIVPPAIWRVDESNPDPLRNGVLVNRSADLITPLALTAVPDCAPPPGLAINRRVVPPGASLVRQQFLDVACLQPAWRLCAEQVVTGAADSMILPGEAAPSGTPSLHFYEHSDAIDTLRIARSGDDLVLRVP
jgi:hypothetical protein